MNGESFWALPAERQARVFVLYTERNKPADAKPTEVTTDDPIAAMKRAFRGTNG